MVRSDLPRQRTRCRTVPGRPRPPDRRHARRCTDLDRADARRESAPPAATPADDGGDRATLTHSSSDGLLEVSAAGISKATGLAALAAQHGVGAGQVVAFGDMPNDLPMLAWAGHAVAVANAHAEVLAAADEVTGRNDEDGVAQVLERWF